MSAWKTIVPCKRISILIQGPHVNIPTNDTTLNLDDMDVEIITLMGTKTILIIVRIYKIEDK